MAYGWQIGKIKSKSSELSNSPKEVIEKELYREMLSDYSHENEDENNVSRAQFKRAITRFDVADYQEELNLIFYFGEQLSHLDLKLPVPKLEYYPEEYIINLGKIYMRRKEPNDYPYFRKIASCHDRIQFCYTAPKNSFLGKSYFLDKDDYYILVNSINGIQDTVTLLHESTHVENYIKYGINLSKYYAELAPITREHYSFDMLSSYDEDSEVEKQRINSLYHYLVRILKLYNAINMILFLKRNQGNLKQLLSDFDTFSIYIDVPYLYALLNGALECEIGYALSFIASLDIYLNCTSNEANLFVTGYQIGIRNVSCKVIDRVVPYLLTTLTPYQKEKII